MGHKIQVKDGNGNIVTSYPVSDDRVAALDSVERAGACHDSSHKIELVDGGTIVHRESGVGEWNY